MYEIKYEEIYKTIESYGIRQLNFTKLKSKQKTCMFSLCKIKNKVWLEILFYSLKKFEQSAEIKQMKTFLKNL